MIQLKETHGRTYQNFSGTYRNVPQKHQACTKTGKNVPELFWNVSERTTKCKTHGRTYQNVAEHNRTFAILTQPILEGGFRDTAIYIYIYI